MKTKNILKMLFVTEAIVIIAVMHGIVASSNANECTTVGKFYGNHEATDINGNTDTYYSFRSNDGSIWWDLTEYQMGFIPNGNVEYILTYDNNGTTKANKSCDCIECECEVYDDEFVSIKQK